MLMKVTLNIETKNINDFIYLHVYKFRLRFVSECCGWVGL